MTNFTNTLVTGTPPDGYSVMWSAALGQWLNVSPAVIVQAGGGGSATPIGSAGGDLTGTYPNPTVAAIRGISVPSPSGSNTLLTWTGSALSWSSIVPNFGSQTIQTTGTVQGGTIGVNNGTTVPTITSGTGAPTSTPPNGSLFMRVDGTSISGVYTYQGGTWSALGSGGGGGGGNTFIVNSTVTATTYAVAGTDQFIPVNSTSNVVTITLPASPGTGEWHIIADISGTAATHNITVSGNGKNIVGSASFVINAAYNSIYVVYNGTNWSII